MSLIQAEIITIGDEILIGQIVDTNSAYMGTLLNQNGISVKQITSVSDNREHILNSLAEAEQRADIILITGGLGPTKDDITKKTLCEYFNCKLRFDEEVYQDVVAIFKAYGKEVTPTNRLQAEVPEICTSIRNHNGTAPGMWIEKGDKTFVSMPGVPYEMKAMMKNQVVPMLLKKYEVPFICHKTVLTQGIGESSLSDLIAPWEEKLAADNIRLAYLPSPGMVRLRLSTAGKEKDALLALIDRKIEELQPLIAQHIYGYENFGEENEKLEQIIGRLLIQKKQTLSTAESCTGGAISQLITSIAGSSEYYIGSVIAYANQVKIDDLSVSQKDIEQYGVVSKMVVEQMARGAQAKFKTAYAIATSGIAGPSGGSEEKPVGTVWIAVASPDGVISEKFLFGTNRERNIQKAANAALDMLRKILEG